jgi:hypothetical protein
MRWPWIMQATLQQDMAPFAQRALAGLRFAPAEDQYYYQAMLYEAIGDDIGARAAWALYAAVPGAPWRGRALDHVQAIDALRRTARIGHPAPAPAPTAPRVPPIPLPTAP